MIKSKLGWKVPFRDVYTDTFYWWVRECWYCHVTLRMT